MYLVRSEERTNRHVRVRLSLVGPKVVGGILKHEKRIGKEGVKTVQGFRMYRRRYPSSTQVERTRYPAGVTDRH